MSLFFVLNFQSPISKTHLILFFTSTTRRGVRNYFSTSSYTDRLGRSPQMSQPFKSTRSATRLQVANYLPPYEAAPPPGIS